MVDELERLRKSIISVASELQRFKGVYFSAIGKLNLEEQKKYISQFSWFDKKVKKALEEAGLRCIDVEGKIYDPGMAVTPLNIDDFDPADVLYVQQMIEPVIMHGDQVAKTGIVILGRVDQ